MMMFHSTTMLLLLVSLSSIVWTTSSSSASETSSVVSHTNTHNHLLRRQLQFPQEWLPQNWFQSSNGNTVDWSKPTAWQDWWDSVTEDARENIDNIDICPVLEMAIGMGRVFGIAAECACDGDLSTTMVIACTFQQCLPITDIIDSVTTAEERQTNPIDNNNGICGNVGLNFTFGGDDTVPGSVAASVCTDFPDSLFQDACFSYSMSIMDNSITQQCGASYGGQECDCTIDNGWCLNVNCSSVLPGAAMDTCQWLQMDTEVDFMSWIPQWNIFDTTNFTLDADMIPWSNLDWDNLDWPNFNVTAIQWTNPTWLTETWTNLVGNVGEGVSEGVCTFLESAVSLTQELGAKGSCKCGTTVSDGLVIDCDFSEICIDNSVGSVAAFDPICAAVNLTLNYDTLSGVDNEVCLDFVDDTHPQTCFSYTIPFADQNMEPSCSATYGKNECTCSIDENFCILVDCSKYEKAAVMNTCQIVDLGGAVEAQQFMLPFQVPQEEETTEGVIDVAEEEEDSSTSTSSSGLAANGDESGSAATFPIISFGSIAAVAAVVVNW